MKCDDLIVGCFNLISLNSFSLTQLAPFLRRIARGVSDEEAMDVLEDLNETSKKRHEILEFFVSFVRRMRLFRREPLILRRCLFVPI